MDIILATNNAHKVEELKRMLEPLGYTLYAQKEKGISIEVEENGATFEENAFLKAKAIYDLTGCAALADDSGLCVDALSGAPGVYSARYAGEPCDDKKNNQKLLKAMDGVETAPPSLSASSATSTRRARPTTSAANAPGRSVSRRRGTAASATTPSSWSGRSPMPR